jgi:hypothetical protein
MMVRAAVRSRTAQPSTRADSAVELLDRTGIIAASLPQRRRTELGSDTASDAVRPTQESRDMDHRPQSVVIRRRATVWIGAAAAGVSLLAIGWLAGGTYATQSADNASPVGVRKNIADRPVVVPPMLPPVLPPATAAPEEVLKVPVQPPPVTQQPPVTSTTRRPSAKPSAEPRLDRPTASPRTFKPQLFDLTKQVAGFVMPFVGAMSGR